MTKQFHLNFIFYSMGNKIAKWISHVFDPAITAFFVMLYAIVEEETHRHPQFYKILFVALFISLIFPLIYTLLLLKLKLISNFFYSYKKDRVYLFPLILLVLLCMLGLLRHFQASQILIDYLEISLILFAFIAILTPVTKISLHMTGLTSLFIISLYLWGIKAVPFGFVLPFVAWSRLKLQQHTGFQVFAGTLLGGSGTLCILYFLNFHF